MKTNLLTKHQCYCSEYGEVYYEYEFERRWRLSQGPVILTLILAPFVGMAGALILTSAVLILVGAELFRILYRMAKELCDRLGV